MKTDPPEAWEDYFVRVVMPRLHPKWTLGEQQEWIESFVPGWKEQEREKLEYQKQLEREKTEYEKTVNRLQVEIEREKNRIAREEFRKREREAREEQRDPTPTGLNRRHPDFAAFAVRLGRALGREAEAIAALQHAEADKSAFCLENDSIGAALLAYLRAAKSLPGQRPN